MISIIGLTGFAGCGKTTVASYLCEAHGFARVRFADPLKGAACEMGLTREQVDGSLKEQPCSLLCGKTPRWFLQWFGTDIIRNQIDQNFWVNAWKLRAQAKLDAGFRIVADDVRFPNEAAAILKFGGMLARVTRPGQVEIAKVSRQWWQFWKPRKHASEAHIDSFICDVHLINDGSIEELERKALHRLVWHEAVPYPLKQAA